MSVYFSNSNITKNVSPYLLDCDVQLLGATSKKMYQIAQKEIQERDQKLEQLLSSYTLLRQFNIQNLKEANLFNIGEVHSNSECNKNQASFIVYLMSRGPVILILEPYKPLIPISAEDAAYDPLLIQIHSLIHPSNQCNLYSIGWDDREELSKIETEIEREYQEKNAQLEPEWKNIYSTAQEILPGYLLPFKEEWSELIQFAMSNCIGNRKKDLHYELFTLLVKGINANVNHFISLIMKKQDSDDIMQCPIEDIELIAVLQERLTIVEALYFEVADKFLDLEAERDKKKDAAVKTTFPIRTKGMVDTLQGLNDLRRNLGMPKAKAVLIAGDRHLNPNHNINNDLDWELDSFYDELTNHQACVLSLMSVLDASEAKKQQLVAEYEARRLKTEEEKHEREQKFKNQIAEQEARKEAIQEELRKRPQETQELDQKK